MNPSDAAGFRSGRYDQREDRMIPDIWDAARGARRFVLSIAALIVPFVVQEVLIVELNRPAVYMALMHAHAPWIFTWLGVMAVSAASGFVLLAVELSGWRGIAALIYFPLMFVALTIVGSSHV